MPNLIRFISQFDNDQEIVIEPSRLDQVDISLEQGEVTQVGALENLPKVVGTFMRLKVSAIVGRATTRTVLPDDNIPALREVVGAAELWRFHWAKVRPMQPEEEGFKEAVNLMVAAEVRLSQAIEKFSRIPVEKLAEGGPING